MKNQLKRGLYILTMSLLIIAGPSAPKAQAQYQGDAYGNNYDAPSYQTFYDDLGAYGQWVQDPSYGYVWVPDVDAGFRPYYSEGHWVMTEYGNTWVSDYPWGWACFHYGRWTYDPYYGWVWIPGNVWGPAWVSWRYGGGYYGWAPLGPGIDVMASFGGYNCPEDWWIFIAPAYIYNHHYYKYWYGPRENGTIIRNTSFVNNTYVNNNVTYVTGPRSTEVTRITGKDVPVYHLANSGSRTNTSISGNELRLYHPMEVKQSGQNGGRPAPTNAVRAPQNIGRPQSANTNTTAPAPFKSVMERTPRPAPSNPPTIQRQEQNTLPITPQRQPVVPKHQIQTDEHVTPQPQQQPGERVPQQNFERPQPQPQRPVQQPEPQRPMSQPQPQRPVQQPQPQRSMQQPQQPQRFQPAPQQPRMQPQPSRPAPQAPRSEPGRR